MPLSCVLANSSFYNSGLLFCDPGCPFCPPGAFPPSGVGGVGDEDETTSTTTTATAEYIVLLEIVSADDAFPAGLASPFVCRLYCLKECPSSALWLAYRALPAPVPAPRRLHQMFRHHTRPRRTATPETRVGAARLRCTTSTGGGQTGIPSWRSRRKDEVH